MARLIVILVLLGSPVLSGCESPVEPPPQIQSDLTTTLTQDGITNTLTIPKNVFGPLDTLTGTFDVLNTTQVDRLICSPHSENVGYELQHGSLGPVLLYPERHTPVQSCFTLASGQMKRFTIHSRFTMSNGQPIPPGQYLLRAYLFLVGGAPKLSLWITRQ